MLTMVHTRAADPAYAAGVATGRILLLLLMIGAVAGTVHLVRRRARRGRH